MIRCVYLGLGSNYGDRFGFLQKACQLCAALPDSFISRVSSVYETSPVGNTEQPFFLNAVVGLSTPLDVMDLFHRTKNIERITGRIPRGTWEMREIDIDVLLDGSTVIGSGPLILPHPRMHERKFVLVPLAEIAPDAVHPLLKQTAEQLLLQCHTDEEIGRTDLKLQILPT